MIEKYHFIKGFIVDAALEVFNKATAYRNAASYLHHTKEALKYQRQMNALAMIFPQLPELQAQQSKAVEEVKAECKVPDGLNGTT